MKPDDFMMSFGKYQGKRLDEIPLVYLDWLVGREWLNGLIRDIIIEYLSDPVIKRELEAELENKTDNIL